MLSLCFLTKPCHEGILGEWGVKIGHHDEAETRAKSLQRRKEKNVLP